MLCPPVKSAYDESMRTMTVRVSRKLYAVVLAISLLGLAAGGYGMAIGEGYEKIKMLLVVLFFILTFIMCGLELINDSPRIVISPRGIEKRHHGNLSIGWDDIDGAFLKRLSRLFGGNYYICLDVKQPGKYLQRMAWHWRLLSKIDTLQKLAPISLALTGLEVDRDALLQVILHNIEEHKKHRPAA